VLQGEGARNQQHNTNTRNMKNTVLVFILFFLWIASRAQVSGTVVNERAEPLVAANVLLLNDTDSLLIKAGITDETGKFTLENIMPGSYRLKITAIGYANYFSPPFEMDTRQQKDAGTITLMTATKELQNVVVRSGKPLYRQTMEGMVVNVENGILTKGNSALQVLGRSPGVVINRRNNSIELNGKGGVMVMLNGKLVRMPESQLLDLLDGMSADDVASIELLTSPSAKYDAEGTAGLINIVLKKNKMRGTNGTVNLSAGYGYREKATAGFNLSHNMAKLNVYGSYNFSHNYTYSNMFVDSWQDMPFLGGQTHALGHDTTHVKHNNHNVNVGADVKLNARTTIGGNVIYGNNRSSGTTWTHLDYNILPDSVLQYDGTNRGKRIWNNIVSSVYLEQRFRKSSQLTISADYLYFNNNGPYDVQGTFVNKHGETAGNNHVLSAPAQKGFAKTNINVVVGRIDYTAPLNEQIQLEAGTKISVTRSNSYSGFESLINGVWTSDPQAVNTILMKETIGAAYVSLATKLSKTTDLITGLRYEYAAGNMNDMKTGQEVVRRRLGALFPSVFLTKKINDQSQLQLSFTRRVTRPSYNDLASYVVYNDPTAVYTGNPFLKPAFTQNIRLGYSYKNHSFALLFSHDKNPISRYQITESPQHDMLFISPQNISWQKSLALQTTLSFKPTDWWSMNYNFIGGPYNYKVAYTKQPFEHTYFFYSSAINQAFKMPRQFSAELSAAYNSTNYNGSQKMQGILRVSLGIKKELKDRSSFQFSITDILQRELYDINYGTLTQEAFSIHNQVIVYSETTRLPVFRLSYSKSFGNNKTNFSKRNNTPDEQERIRKE
jgi:iron complex outermembrane recepter protein